MSSTPAPRGHHEHLDGLGVFLIVSCCAAWALQQVAVKAALSEIPPLFQGGIRSLGATILVYGWARVRGIALFGRDRTFGPGLLAGLLFALEFLFIYMALPHTNASRLVVFLYLAPFVVALLLPRFEPAERLRKIQLVGLVCAFLALAYAFQEGFGLTSREQLWGDFLAVSAAVMWGLTTLTIRATRLATAAPEKTLFYQLAVSAVFLLIASRVRGEIWPVHISTLGIASLLFQTVAVAFVSYLAWFWLLRHYSATKISAFSFLTPIFGLMFGALILGETIGIRLVLALTFVTLGVFLVNRKTSARVGKSAQ